MKKLLTILTLSVFAMSSMFAMVAVEDTVSGKSAIVQLDTSIEETQLTYELAYDGNLIKDTTTEYSIKVNPLSENGYTNVFTVTATSNLNSDLGVEVVVTPDSFRTTLNDGADEFNSKITPEVSFGNTLDTIKAGQHINLLVNEFKLGWKGNATLPAGDYVSNVKISYTIK